MIAVFPAIMVSILLPILVSRHVPDAVLGCVAGVLLGLSMVGIVALARRPGSCV
jgi:hypothetical protein